MISGLSQFFAKLDQVDDQVRKAARDGERRLADQVAAAAVSAAPFDSGDLMRSIRVEQDGEQTVVAVEADHAAHIEFGTTHTPAEPYLRPALYGNSEGKLRTLGQAVREVI